MTSGLLTKDRDPLYLFTARNGMHSSIGSPSTAHLYRKDSAQTLRFQAFRRTGRAARAHSPVSRICPMFTYLVHSIALFCAALQCHWPKVDDRKEFIEKKRNSFLQRSRDRRRLLLNSPIQNRNLVRASCDLSHETPQPIGLRASALRQQPISARSRKFQIKSMAVLKSRPASLKRRPPPPPPPSPSCLPPTPRGRRHWAGCR